MQVFTNIHSLMMIVCLIVRYYVNTLVQTRLHSAILNLVDVLVSLFAALVLQAEIVTN